MIRRIIEVSSEGLYLSKDRGFIVLEDKEKGQNRVPLSDIAVLMLTAKGLTITKSLMVALLEIGSLIVICGKSYMPVSIITPLSGNYELSGRIRTQMSMKEPLKKQLWRTVVVKKITNQALVLKHRGLVKASRELILISQEVVSGDSTNKEGLAAKIYWDSVFGEKFKRDYEEEFGINAHLNYGYAILRSIVARGICATGLHPTFGINHRNKLNEYCLVDDLMEPFRPMVDYLVLSLLKKTGELSEVTAENKVFLSKISSIDFYVDKGMSPLIKAVEYYVFSFYTSLKQKTNCLSVPEYQELGDIFEE